MKELVSGIWKMYPKTQKKNTTMQYYEVVVSTLSNIPFYLEPFYRG